MQNNTTPFDVGRSFVHQYYTLLHQAPDMLHRFYSNDSTFIHGGLDSATSTEQLSIGPENIAHRIRELNIRDCHAKIRQVDSHPTIGNGVVIQVTGELSNNGQPMRRFMQTFVLAPREPKKYYVQNDIFRYQDEVFDEGSEEDDQSSSQDKVSNADSSVMASQQSAPVVNTNQPIVEEEQPLPPRRVVQPATVVAQQPTNNESSVRTEESNGIKPTTHHQETQDAVKAPSTEPQQTKSTPSEGASSYAGIIKMNQSANTSVTVQSAPVNPAPTPIPANPARISTNKRTPNSQRTGNEPPTRPNNRGRSSNETSTVDSRNSILANTPNDHQVFVGSLPAHFTQQDLINCFSQFGKVLDAKIGNSAQDHKKKYGFVAFDNAETVSVVVSEQHVTFNGFRLNVEAKIPKNTQGNPSGPGNQRNSYPQRGGRGSGGYNRSFRNGGTSTRREVGQYQNDSATFNASEENNKNST